jgi:hypothetical protein
VFFKTAKAVLATEDAMSNLVAWYKSDTPNVAFNKGGYIYL